MTDLFEKNERACLPGLFGWLFEALFVFLSLLTVLTADAAYCEEKKHASTFVRSLRVGIAAHDVDGLWSGSSKEKGPDLIAEIVFNQKLFQLMSAAAYPNAGVTINTHGDTSKLYAGFLMRWAPFHSLFLSTGLGLALHNGETDTEASDKKSLGSQLLFRIPIEIGFAFTRHHRLFVCFDHISNAYLTSPNEGLDTLGLVYAFHF